MVGFKDYFCWGVDEAPDWAGELEVYVDLDTGELVFGDCDLRASIGDYILKDYRGAYYVVSSERALVVG